MDLNVNETYKLLYQLYFEKLFLFANSYLRDVEESKEIVQNAFVKLWEKRSRLSSKKNINSYLFTMVKNACLDKLKHDKVKLNYKSNILQLENTIHFDALNNDIATKAIQQELIIRVYKEIDKLPESSRQIFIKSKIEGIKAKDIANELELSVRTVENQIFRATNKLKDKFKSLNFILLLIVLNTSILLIY